MAEVKNCLDQHYPLVEMLGNIKLTYTTDSEWLRIGEYWDAATGRMTEVTGGGPFGSNSLSFTSTASQTQSLLEYRVSFSRTPITNPTADFTIEGWFKFSAVRTVNDTVLTFKQDKSVSGQGVLLTVGAPGSPVFRLSTYSGSSTAASGTTSITTGSWYHLAIVRSGTTMKLFVNGVQDISFTFSGALGIGDTTTDWAFNLGSDAGVSYQGQFDEMRLTYGVARYTGQLVVPTARFPDSVGSPVMAAITQLATVDGTVTNEINASTTFVFTQLAKARHAGVALLLHMDGANGSTTFTDEGDAPHTVTTGSGAAVSTTTQQFGTGSLRSGSTSGQRLDIAADFWFDMQDEDFTVEGWSNVDNPNNTRALYSGTNSARNSARGPSVSYSSTTIVGEVYDSAGGNTIGRVVTSASVVGFSTWFHWAYVRSGNTFKVFINGVQSGSTVTSSGTAGVPTYVEINQNPAVNAFAALAYTDEVRVLKGIAQYTANFTVPTVPFGTVGGTLSAVASQTLGNPATVATVTVTPMAVVGVQTLPAFAQAGTVFGVSSTINFNQTLPPFTQAYFVTGPARVAQGGVVGDPYFPNVMLLLQANSSWVDGSPYARTLAVAADGYYQIGGTSSQTKFGSGAVEFLPPASASNFSKAVGLPAVHTDFDFGSNDFTFETWVRQNVLGTTAFRLELSEANGATYDAPFIAIYAERTGVQQTMRAMFRGTSTVTTLIGSVLSGAELLANTWQHVALSRNGTALALYVDGKMVASDTISGSLMSSTSGLMPLVRFWHTSTLNTSWRGWTDDTRITRGVGRYPTSFDIPTEEIPALRGVAPLLITQSATAAHAAVDRTLTTGGDPYYANTNYILHGASATSLGGDNYSTPDSGRFASPVSGVMAPADTVAGAIGGTALSFETYTLKPGYYYQADFDSHAIKNGGLDVDGTFEIRFQYATPELGWFVNFAESLRLGLCGGGYPADYFFFPDVTALPFMTLHLKGGLFNRVLGPGHELAIEEFGDVQLVPGEWYHIAVVRSGTTLTVYVNGVKDIEITVSTDYIQRDSYFTVGDVNRGIASFEDRQPITYFQEMRQTFGVARYLSEFVPPTAAHPDTYSNKFNDFSNVATIIANLRLLSAAQTLPAFAQTASLYGAGPRAINTDQPLAPFTQSALVSGAAVRLIGATASMGVFAQVATISDPRRVDWMIQPVQPFAQVATITTTRTAAAAQTVTVTQVATVVHRSAGAVSSAGLGNITQVATVRSLLALTQGQILLSFGQSALCAARVSLVASGQLGFITQDTLIEGAFISTSVRGIRVPPETRTFVPHTQRGSHV